MTRGTLGQPASKRYLPLSETTYLIMLSLAPEPRHGYAIMKDVHSISQGRINLRAGTLYSTLKRLLEQGLIVRTDENPPVEAPGKPRKAYSLTKLGNHVLEAEILRLRSLVRVAHLNTVERRS